MRLINADSLTLFPNNPESGTNEMINNWIDECELSKLELYITEDCPIDIEHALKELCWKVIQGYVNVIETEPIVYDVKKVIEQLDEEADVISIPHNYSIEKKVVISLNDAIEIVERGGITNES